MVRFRCVCFQPYIFAGESQTSRSKGAKEEEKEDKGEEEEEEKREKEEEEKKGEEEGEKTATVKKRNCLRKYQVVNES